MKKTSRWKKSRILSVFLAVFIMSMIVFSAAPVISSDITGGEETEGTIIGTVIDAETNEPISGVLITLTYHEVIRTELTDPKGQYMFDNVPLCFCLKNVSAAKSGYENQYKLVAVHKIAYVNFSLEPNDDSSSSMYGIITGIVTDAETDEHIAEALMILKYHDVIRTELTDSKGKYTFTEVPLCFCLKNLSASKKGYEEQYKLVAVSEVTYVNFSLEPESGDIQDTNLISGKIDDNDGQIEHLSIYVVVSATMFIMITLTVWIIRHSTNKKNRNKQK